MNPEQAEQALISTLLVSDAALYAVHTEEGLRPEHFRAPGLGVVYRAMVELDDESGGYDRVSITARAEQIAGEAMSEVIAFHGSMPGRVTDLRRMAAVIRDAHLGRGLARVASELANGGDDPRGTLERGMRALDDIAVDSSAKQARAIADIAGQVVEEAHAIDGSKDLTGIPSGFRKLDELTGGFQPKRLYIVAARPGMGKSALANAFALHATEKGFKVGIWNLEMGDTEVGQRFIASLANMPLRRFLRGNMADHTVRKLADAGSALSRAQMWIDDTADLSIGDIRSRVRRLHQRHRLDLVVVDYLQLIRKNKDLSEHSAIGEISRGLKILAKDLAVPVIALSQLNREVEKRSSAQRPQLSDLRGSGDIEQDADFVSFIYRESYYDKESPTQNAELLIPKHRNGGTAAEGDIYLGWDGPTMRYFDVE